MCKLFLNTKNISYNNHFTYEKYNNKRLHSSVADLPPQTFWELHEKDLIEKTVDEDKRKIKFKLKIPYHEVAKHTGNNEPEGSSLLDFEKIEMCKKRVGAENL